MMIRPNYIYHSPCYYCICTICTERICPFSDKCSSCLSRNKDKIPRLDCDYFSSCYSRRFRVRRGVAQHTYSVYYKDLCVYSGLSLSEARQRCKNHSGFYVRLDSFHFPYSD